jgi:hypothetical protein
MRFLSTSWEDERTFLDDSSRFHGGNRGSNPLGDAN